MLGDRLMIPPGGHEGDTSASHDNMTLFNTTLYSEVADWCNKNLTGDLYHRYCHLINDTMSCDPFYLHNEAQAIPGIPGIASGVIKSNFHCYKYL